MLHILAFKIWNVYWQLKTFFIPKYIFIARSTISLISIYVFLWFIFETINCNISGFPLLPGEDEADQMACIIELLGMPPQRLIEQGKRSKNFISSKGLPRYCTASTLPDGTTVLSGGKLQCIDMQINCRVDTWRLQRQKIKISWSRYSKFYNLKNAKFCQTFFK